MASRLNLHEELCKKLGSRNVYFQTPESMKMKYPAIRYSLANIDVNQANNKKYKQLKSYEIRLIDSDPDSLYFDAILDFQYCSFDRMYTADNLNHFIFTLYY